MKKAFKFTGVKDLKSITLRGVTFDLGKPVEVPDASLSAKIENLPYFEVAGNGQK